VEERTQGNRPVEEVQVQVEAYQAAVETVRAVKRLLPWAVEVVACLPSSSFLVSSLGPRLLALVVVVLRSHPEEGERMAKEEPHQRLEWPAAGH
jgi:hypothetical protein